ncbi:MAG: hypothetical protein KIS76_13310 [Pyrinomonadaceae bacterium]|nr:hypothetical protein [Pyrinomonadaceae bacterium]
MKPEDEMKKRKKSKRSSVPEKIDAEESLRKMNAFDQRKEEIIAFIKQSKD